jgi:hypothetical protein
MTWFSGSFLVIGGDYVVWCGLSSKMANVVYCPVNNMQD